MMYTITKNRTILISHQKVFQSSTAARMARSIRTRFFSRLRPGFGKL